MSFAGHTDIVRSCIFLHTANTVASCSEDSRVILWNSKSGQMKHTFAEHTNAVTSLSVDDHNLMATASSDGTICVYDVEQLKVCNYF
jgi:WD40 repeat protein